MVKMQMPDNFFLGILAFRNSLATSPAATMLLHVSVSNLYIPTICLPILLQENMWWTDPANI
jgi:hypothetical protein